MSERTLPRTTLHLQLPPLTVQQADAILDLLYRLETAVFEAYERDLMVYWRANGDLPGCDPEAVLDGDALDDSGIPA